MEVSAVRQIVEWMVLLNRRNKASKALYFLQWARKDSILVAKLQDEISRGFFGKTTMHCLDRGGGVSF